MSLSCGVDIAVAAKGGKLPRIIWADSSYRIVIVDDTGYAVERREYDVLGKKYWKPLPFDTDLAELIQYRYILEALLDSIVENPGQFLSKKKKKKKVKK